MWAEDITVQVARAFASAQLESREGENHQSRAPATAGAAHSPGVGYSGPPNPLKGLFKVYFAEKARGSIPGGEGLEGLFLRNRLGRCRHPVTVSRRVAADEHTNTNAILIRGVFVSSKRP